MRIVLPCVGWGADIAKEVNCLHISMHVYWKIATNYAYHVYVDSFYKYFYIFTLYEIYV